MTKVGACSFEINRTSSSSRNISAQFIYFNSEWLGMAIRFQPSGKTTKNAKLVSMKIETVFKVSIARV